MRPDRAGRRRRVRRSATRHAACSSRRRTCSVSCQVIWSKSLWRSSSSGLYPLELAGTAWASCSRFICELLSPRALAHTLARSGDIGRARLRPGRAPAAMRGSGGAQKMSKAASNVARSSFRLTKTARSALLKSAWSLRSMWLRARVASVSRRGPASSPASWRSRAKAPNRGRRSGTAGLLDHGRDLLANALQVFLVFERGTEGSIDQRGVDSRRSKRGQGSCPVECLGHPRDLVEIHATESLHQRCDIARKSVRCFRRAGPHDLHLLLEVRVIDPVVETAALESVVNLAGAVRRDDHERGLLGFDGADLGDRDLEVGQQLEQKGLELFVRPVDLIDQEHRRRGVVVVDGVQQRAAEEELRAEDLTLCQPAVFALVEEPDVQELAWVVPLVNRVGEVDSLVALEADEPSAKHFRHDLGGLRLSHPRLTFDEERLFQLQREEDRRREAAIADVALFAKALLNVVDAGGNRSHDERLPAASR